MNDKEREIDSLRKSLTFDHARQPWISSEEKQTEGSTVRMATKVHPGPGGSASLIIFDFDGTLADSGEVFIEAFNQAALALGAVPYRRFDAERLKQLDAYDVLEHHGVRPNQVHRFIELMRLEMSSRALQIQLFPNVPSVLQDLVKNGHYLALVTSNTRESVMTVMGEEVNKLFSGAWYDIPLTEKEATLKKVVRGSGVTSSNAHYVGDELRDFKAAQAARINFIGVSWGFNTAYSLRMAGCITVVDQLSELPALLRVKDYNI